jgi:hypothetical protein
MINFLPLATTLEEAAQGLQNTANTWRLISPELYKALYCTRVPFWEIQDDVMYAEILYWNNGDVYNLVTKRNNICYLRHSTFQARHKNLAELAEALIPKRFCVSGPHGIKVIVTFINDQNAHTRISGPRKQTSKYDFSIIHRIIDLERLCHNNPSLFTFERV